MKDLNDIEPTLEDLQAIELEEIDYLDEDLEDPFIQALQQIDIFDQYEGEPIDLHNTITFKGTRIA